MKVIHISPTYFDETSVIGGGERYLTELSLAMSKKARTTLVSFSPKRQSFKRGELCYELFPVHHFIRENKIDPFAFRHLSQIIRADVVHIHVLSAFVSEISGIFAALSGKPVFVTDYGGGSGFVHKLNSYLPMFWCYRRAIAYSDFGMKQLPPILRKKTVVIKGGVDLKRFCPNVATPKERSILYVGRVLPHKGINYLIESFRLANLRGYTLKILGKAYDNAFYLYLKQISQGLSVEFINDAPDERLIEEYRKTLVTVLPSVHTDYMNRYTPVPELMGSTLLESQACGTPVICTDAGAMSEFVSRDRTGLVVKQNSPAALTEAIQKIASGSNNLYTAMQRREWVATFGWETVVEKYLGLYSAT